MNVTIDISTDPPRLSGPNVATATIQWPTEAIVAALNACHTPTSQSSVPSLHGSVVSVR